MIRFSSFNLELICTMSAFSKSYSGDPLSKPKYRSTLQFHLTRQTFTIFSPGCFSIVSPLGGAEGSVVAILIKRTWHVKSPVNHS